MRRRNWNNSALSLLETCGEAYRRRYEEREEVGSSLRMKQGSAVHAVGAEAHKRMRDAWDRYGEEAIRYAVPSVEEAKDLAAGAFEAELERNETVFTSEDFLSGAKAAEGYAKDNAVEMAALYVEEVAPGVRPVAVERMIEVRPKDMDIAIFGTLDLVDEPRSGGGEEIVDLKTSARTPPKDMADKSPQLTMYTMLRAAETGTAPEREVRLDYLVRTPKAQELKAVTLRSRRDASDVRALVEKLNTAILASERGVFMPDTQSWKCSEKWCEFWSSCKYVSDRRKRG